MPRFSIGEYLGNIVDDCDRGSHGHAEQKLRTFLFPERKQHDGRRHRVENRITGE